MPRPGRESASDRSAIAAIAAARITLGSGVTSTTNPTSATAATRDAGQPRHPDPGGDGERESDDDRAVRPGHRGQVAERADVFMAASSVGVDGGGLADRETRQQPAAGPGQLRGAGG